MHYGKCGSTSGILAGGIEAQTYYYIYLMKFCNLSRDRMIVMMFACGITMPRKIYGN